MAHDQIVKRAKFDFIRYANVWEDATILCQALNQEKPGRILSIASGGDNALALLTICSEVIAVDLSLPQLACVDIKKAAITHLSHAQCLAFFGITPATNRIDTYQQLHRSLTKESQAFWDHNQTLITQGLIHAGKFERYFSYFRRFVLPLIHRQKKIMALLTAKSADERMMFYDKQWNTWRWRLLFNLFFSRKMMGRLGRDAEFFRYVEGSVAKQILVRTKHALTALDTQSNPYLNYILTGNFAEALPYYLQAKHFKIIKSRIESLQCYHGEIQQASNKFGPFIGFNLSDIFEYLDRESGLALYDNLLQQAAPNARFAYWNMLVPRRFSEELTHSVHYLETLAKSLFKKDNAFFYRDFIVEEKKC